MSLRELIETDLETTLEDPNGFGWPITVTDPDGNSASLYGQSNDIAQLIDPDTGQAVSGRFPSVSLRISSLVAAGLVGLPAGQPNADAKPWIVEFDDVGGSSYTFKVKIGDPDRTLMVVTCTLESYQS